MLTLEQQSIIDEAIAILRDNMKPTGPLVDSVVDTMNLAYLRLRGEEREKFLVIFLGVSFHYITDEIMFQGSQDGCQVSPRDIARRALELNAKAVVVAHNHPSGSNVPGDEDIDVTKSIAQALGLIDVMLLDHVVVGEQALSMAKEELMG